MRTLSKDRLLSLRKNQPIMSSLTDAELSLHLDVDASDYIAPARAQKKQRDNNSYLTFEPVPDHLPAKDIIAIAKVSFIKYNIWWPVNNLQHCSVVTRSLLLVRLLDFFIDCKDIITSVLW